MMTSGLCSRAQILAFTKDGEFVFMHLSSCKFNFSNLSQAGEKAFGQFANPSFFRTNSREEANQIFVKSYMRHCVARHAS